MASRFTFSEAVFAILVVAGGLTALAADRLELEALKNAGILAVVSGIVVFGLDMVVHRRADIGTGYSSSINPSFNVFRGVGAIAWGIVFVTTGLLLGGYLFISLTNWTAAQSFFRERDGIVVALVGVLLTALGVGRASPSTYRYKQSERSARRLSERVAAIAFIIPIGLALLSWGLLKTLAPSTALAAKAATVGWLESLVK